MWVPMVADQRSSFAASCLLLLHFTLSDQERFVQEDYVDVSIATEPVDEQGTPEAIVSEDVEADENVMVDGRGGPDVEEARIGSLATEIVVYSDVVGGAAACTSYEKYDPVTEVCFFGCENDAQCEQIQDQISREVEFNEEDFISHSEGDHEKITPKNVVARYSIDDEWITLTSGKKKDIHQAIWEKFALISPDVMTDAYVSTFIVYDDSESDTGAFVAHANDRGLTWEIFINEDVFQDDDLHEGNALLIHEFAHIMTLNQAQVDTQTDESVCERFYTGEGCANDDSYIQKFVSTFWDSGDLLQLSTLGNVDENEDEEEEEEGDKISDERDIDFYKDREGDFVTEYAATNPGEDIAESFTMFVLGSKPVLNIQDKISGGSRKAEEKILFFYGYPELVKLRTAIRQNLGIERIFEKRL